MFEKSSTAFHEAGHVIVGSLNHIKIDSSFVNEDFSGWTNSSNVLPNPKFNSQVNNYLINAWIYFNYGGLLTDRYNFTLNTGSKKYPQEIKIGASLDTKEISNYIIKYNLAAPGKSRSALKQKMQRRTSKMVKEYWGDIVIISHLIYNKKNHIIYYDDIRQTLTKISENKLFWKKMFREIDIINKLSLDDITSADFKNIV